MKQVKWSLCFGLMWVLCACANLQRSEAPGVSVTSLQFGEPDGMSQSFVIGVSIINPNRTELHIQGMSYALALNGFELLQGVKNTIPPVAAYGEVQLELHAKTNLVNAVRFVNNYLNRGLEQDLAYRLTAKVDLGGWSGPIKLVEEGQIPTVTGLNR